MRFCQSERAIKAREWRATQREKRRFDTLLSDYAKVKYQDVYKECTEFYRVLNKTYPKKHDLTKTKEYRRWKNRATGDIEISHGQSSDEAEIPSTPTARQSSDEAEIPSTPTARQSSDEAEIPSTPTARQSSDEAEMPSTPTARQSSDEAEMPSAATARQSSDEAEMPSAATARQSSDKAEMPSAATVRQSSDEAEIPSAATARQSSDEAEPSMEEPVQNLIQLAAGDLIPDSPPDMFANYKRTRIYAI